MSDSLDRKPRFCRHCGAHLPPGEPRFCIECGGDVYVSGAANPPAAPAPPAPATPPASARKPAPRSRVAPTVQLPNAGVAQSVIGGTVQLPTSGAVPPGLWVLDEPPGADDVVALYAPLRAVSGGWSGLIGKGWQLEGSEDRPDGRAIFRFTAEVEWFPAPGCGRGQRLRLRIGAESRGREGRARRGFRYQAHHDPPMTVLSAAWLSSGDSAAIASLPLPQFQIMAPPRVARISDFDEQVETMLPAEAERWVKDGQTPELYRCGPTGLFQEQTPVGRGISMRPVNSLQAKLRSWMANTLGSTKLLDPSELSGLYRVRIVRPFVCELKEWSRKLKAIRAEALSLGMALEAEPAAEWWLDRNGYDGVIFNGARARYDSDRVAIVFRRSQIVRVSE